MYILQPTHNICFSHPFPFSLLHDKYTDSSEDTFHFTTLPSYRWIYEIWAWKHFAKYAWLITTAVSDDHGDGIYCRCIRNYAAPTLYLCKYWRSYERECYVYVLLVVCRTMRQVDVLLFFFLDTITNIYCELVAKYG